MTMNPRKAELLGLKLMKTSGLMQDAAHDLFKSHGLSAPQYNVLRILRGAGTVGLNCREIADRMITRVPDITRLLDRLAEKDLVTRLRSEEDRRVVTSTLTEAGTALLSRIDRPLNLQVTANFRNLSGDDMKRLDGILDRLLAGLENRENAAPPGAA